MVHASKMKRDPATNQPFEVWEDDIIDLDFNVEREHEDLHDVLAPHTLEEIGYDEEEAGDGISPGPGQDEDEQDMVLSDDSEEEEQDYSRDKTISRIPKWTRLAEEHPPWNHLNIEPISKKSALDNKVIWHVNEDNEIMFRHQATGVVDTQAGHQRLYDESEHEVKIKIEPIPTEDRSPGSNQITTETTAKKPKKVIRARKIVHFEDTEEDPTEDFNNDDDQYESMEGFYKPRLLPNISCSDPRRTEAARIQQRKNADQEMNLEVQMHSLTTQENTFETYVDEEELTAEEIRQVEANDIILRKWNKNDDVPTWDQ